MRDTFRILFILLLSCWTLVAAELNSSEIEFSAEQIEFFEKNVRPVLVAHCYECHSTDAPELQAKLYVDSREGMIGGGESGPAIVPGNPDESSLIAAVRYETNEMPPERKLSAKDIRSLEQWVEMGAPWPPVTSSPGIPANDAPEIDWEKARASHWAWQPYLKPSVPPIATGGDTNPIDGFVMARRDHAQIAANGPATSRVLVRRIYIDLVGIVPTPDQVHEFIREASQNRQQAITSLVDELLLSPLYGQRWGRHWLDVARYSDGRGGFLDSSGLDDAWRYRDWVVKSLNDDVPIDEFLELQIAGDLIGDREDAVATGFFALGPTYRSDGGDPDSVAQAKGETLDDRMDTLTRGLLGITGSCARCHDHKFDPIPQQDYYSLAGVFNNSDVHRLPLADQEVVDAFNQHKQAVADLNKKIKTHHQKIKQEKRASTAEEQQQLDQWQDRLEDLKANPAASFDTAHALKETGTADMHVAIRGNLRKTGELAPRRFLRILAGENPVKFKQGSGRRELAAAIVDKGNPLTARVFVNRVWKHHFGEGLVRTPSNFGSLGESPTHPELLDWLAADFVEHGWSLKRLHRQILTSATYQLSSRYDPESFRKDGDNRFLWRMSPQRMDVEVWRDSLLFVSNQLDITPGGPPHDDITASQRRTLYAKVSRNGDVFVSDAFLRRFDFPLMRATVAKRPRSIVPQQFLFLLNSSFMVDQAKAFAARLHHDALADSARIVRAYELLYGRQPQDAELQIGLEFLHSQGNADGQLSPWDQYAQALLSSNEFMFVR